MSRVCLSHTCYAGLTLDGRSSPSWKMLVLGSNMTKSHQYLLDISVKHTSQLVTRSRMSPSGDMFDSQIMAIVVIV